LHFRTWVPPNRKLNWVVAGGTVAGSLRLVRGRDVWELRVFAGRDAAGRVRHRHATFRGTRREAERALARLVADGERKPRPVSSRWGETTTINDALLGWRDNGWEDLSPSTTRRYQSIWDTHIKRSIGTRRIHTLSPYDVESYFRALKAVGLSESSVRQNRPKRSCTVPADWPASGAVAFSRTRFLRPSCRPGASRTPQSSARPHSRRCGGC
jgi:hypothetical protein